MTKLEKLKARLRAWVHELDAGGPNASLAPSIITGLQAEIWALEEAAIAAADRASVEGLELWPTKHRNP